MTPLRQRMIEDLRIRGLAQYAQRLHVGAALSLQRHARQGLEFLAHRLRQDAEEAAGDSDPRRSAAAVCRHRQPQAPRDRDDDLRRGATCLRSRAAQTV